MENSVVLPNSDVTFGGKVCESVGKVVGVSDWDVVGSCAIVEVDSSVLEAGNSLAAFELVMELVGTPEGIPD